MILGPLLIGLREGLEASLVVAILLTYVRRIQRPDIARKIWLGVSVAVIGSLALGAVLTFGAYGLSFQAQEIIGGTMSLIAVGMVTWMVFWMLRASKSLKGDLEHEVDRHLGGSGWGVTVVAFLAVAREGLETALFVWSTTRGTAEWLPGFTGAVLGILAAVALAYIITRGFVRIDLSRFFTWTGAVLIVVAAGVVAYSIHDLQEAAVLPGPFMAPPTDAPASVALWYGDTSWAFRVSDVIAPDGFLGAILKGTIGFEPEMTWLSVIGWALYLGIVMTAFIRVSRRGSRRRAVASSSAVSHHPITSN